MHHLAANASGPLAGSIRPWVPVVLAIVLTVEFMLLRLTVRDGYDWRESAASFAIALGQRLIKPITALLYAGLFESVWQARLWTLPLDRGWSIPLIVLAVEFAYYGYHRSSHTVRLFWTSHLVHHSVQHLNLSAAYRLGWTSGLTGAGLFFLPLMWLGISPAAVLAALTANLLYQFWLHTELVPKLGVVEWIFNTPSHHRVHHASNPDYLDRNYGGILIVFDRLFGSFAAERADEPCRYGLTEPLATHNPFRIALHGWITLSRDIASDLRQGLWRRLPGRLFAAPSWQPVDHQPVSRSVPLEGVAP